MFAVWIAAYQQAFGERQFVAEADTAARNDMHVDVKDALRCRPAVINHQVAAIGVQTGGSRRAGDPLTERDNPVQGRCRCVGEVCGVLFGDHQGVAAGDRPDVEERQIMIVLVDADGRCVTGDDGAEHTGHACHGNA